jgi:hypothetical protein
LDLLAVRWRQQQAREDRRAAMGAWLLANINRDSEKRPEPFTLQEIVSWLGHGFQQETTPTPAPPPAQDQASAEALMERLMAMKMMNDAFRQAQGPNGAG